MGYPPRQEAQCLEVGLALNYGRTRNFPGQIIDKARKPQLCSIIYKARAKLEELLRLYGLERKI